MYECMYILILLRDNILCLASNSQSSCLSFLCTRDRHVLSYIQITNFFWIKCYKALNLNPGWERGSRGCVLLLMTDSSDALQRSQLEQLMNTGMTATSSATNPMADIQGPKEPSQSWPELFLHSEISISSFIQSQTLTRAGRSPRRWGTTFLAILKQSLTLISKYSLEMVAWVTFCQSKEK